MLKWFVYAVIIALVLSNVRQYFSEPPETIKVGSLTATEFSSEPLPHITSMYFSSDDVLYAATENGEIYLLADQLKDGRADVTEKIASGMSSLLGIFPYEDRIYVSMRGSVAYLEDKDDDGTFESRKTIIEGLPNGRHQNNSIVIGPDSRIYVAVGSTADRGPEPHPFSSTILTSSLDGSDLKVFAKGLRNPYGLAFDAEGRLWATDNGPDDPPAPDELNLIQKGKDYGFPKEFGAEQNNRSELPISMFDVHSSSNSIIFLDDAYGATYDGMPLISQFGEFFGGSRVGRQLVWVDLANDDPSSSSHSFFTGLDRPLGLAKDSLGRVYFSEYDSGRIYRLESGDDESLSARRGVDTDPFRELRQEDKNSGLAATDEVRIGASEIERRKNGSVWTSPIYLLAGVLVLLAVGIILLRLMSSGKNISK